MRTPVRVSAQSLRSAISDSFPVPVLAIVSIPVFLAGCALSPSAYTIHTESVSSTVYSYHYDELEACVQKYLPGSSLLDYPVRNETGTELRFLCLGPEAIAAGRRYPARAEDLCILSIAVSGDGTVYDTISEVHNVPGCNMILFAARASGVEKPIYFAKTQRSFVLIPSEEYFVFANVDGLLEIRSVESPWKTLCTTQIEAISRTILFSRSGEALVFGWDQHPDVGDNAVRGEIYTSDGESLDLNQRFAIEPPQEYAGFEVCDVDPSTSNIFLATWHDTPAEFLDHLYVYTPETGRLKELRGASRSCHFVLQDDIVRVCLKRDTRLVSLSGIASRSATGSEFLHGTHPV